MNEQVVYAALGGARKSVPEAGDYLSEDAEIDIVSEDGVTPVSDRAESRR